MATTTIRYCETDFEVSVQDFDGGFALTATAFGGDIKYQDKYLTKNFDNNEEYSAARAVLVSALNNCKLSITISDSDDFDRDSLVLICNNDGCKFREDISYTQRKTPDEIIRDARELADLKHKASIGEIDCDGNRECGCDLAVPMITERIIEQFTKRCDE